MRFIKHHTNNEQYRAVSLDTGELDEYVSAWSNNQRQTQEVRTWLKRYAEFDYRTRFDCHLALYIPDLAALDKVFKRYKDQIETIEAPISEQHNNTMIDDLNVTVREKLFYNNYRYKVSSYLYRDKMDSWVDLMETCESSFEKGSYKYNPTLRGYLNNKELEQKYSGSQPRSIFSSYRRFIGFSGTATIYLKDYEDVCTLHMLFKNIITSTTKIILKSELE